MAAKGFARLDSRAAPFLVFDVKRADDLNNRKEETVIDYLQ